jgi:nicotinamidase-related amidase
VELFRGSDVWEEVTVERRLPVAETAILLCDLWDNHWCSGAARRVEAMVPAVEATVAAARAAGVQIIHAPSDTMAFYADAPQRRRILDVPRVAPPEPLDLPSPPLPIDDSDGGCDSGEKPWHRAWTRQYPGITIADPDVISDNGIEVYSFLAHRGIKHLAIMGVHTNMCVLNRSFAIKQMTKWGIRCLLVRDLTDAMYNPAMRPYVSHEAGTDLVIEHIEKHWCPSILSRDLRGVEASTLIPPSAPFSRAREKGWG